MTKMTQLVTMSVDDRICTLSLNRPEVMNALNHKVFGELQACLEKVADAGSDIGCVILKGEGRAFSSGHDLRDIEEGLEDDQSAFEAGILEALASLPVPTIAQVHGYCFTGALELALACDLIFIDEKTRLADTHSKWGLSPVWGMTQRLPRRIGPARAKDMMFSSRTVEAREALDIGLVDRVFAEGELEAKTTEYAAEVAANSNHSHRVCKQVIEATDGLRLHDGLDYEYTNSPGACHDMQERVAAFINRKG